MATINEMIFLLQVIIIISITVYRIFNLLNGGEIHINTVKGGKFAFSISIISFIVVLLCWLFGLYIVMLEFDTWLYASIFKLENFLLGLNVFFLIIELFLIVNLTAQPVIKPFNSKKNYPYIK